MLTLIQLFFDLSASERAMMVFLRLPSFYKASPMISMGERKCWGLVRARLSSRVSTHCSLNTSKSSSDFTMNLLISQISSSKFYPCFSVNLVFSTNYLYSLAWPSSSSFSSGLKGSSLSRSLYFSITSKLCRRASLEN